MHAGLRKHYYPGLEGAGVAAVRSPGRAAVTEEKLLGRIWL